ncbi:uncharacterized protein B0H18DRAFT_1064234 [Fomitopsis serialis]|uniref:uncharacterized protein n=1 Tax=Fomitopsis serialis TaxID=139415 RepID=UPI0020085A25|nr:uncharacterized protein B0H18DRAFT_1064234 [Neoantrodia serialis]KAH9911190.1 hypothetical protein B0H18DRAFT_1064234 [Neoantrodia serialis]
MVATLILTRTFAICAMIVGGAPSDECCPIISSSGIQHIDERNCRFLGCLFAAPNVRHASTADIPSLSGTADTTPEASVPSEATETSSGGIRMAHIIAKPSTISASGILRMPQYCTPDLDAEWAELLPEIDSLENERCQKIWQCPLALPVYTHIRAH